jgi:hypothetical protein
MNASRGQSSLCGVMGDQSFDDGKNVLLLV